MVFDVESVGLHGEGFAVGWVVLDQKGVEVEMGFHACASIVCAGTEAGHAWVQKNIPDFEVNCENPEQVRFLFWSTWKLWKAKGAQLFADCAWPVEARFLARCVDDDLLKREWEGPYPLHDIASYILPMGDDPLETRERGKDELPVHHPFYDARQSGRVLFEAIHRRQDELKHLL